MRSRKHFANNEKTSWKTSKRQANVALCSPWLFGPLPLPFLEFKSRTIQPTSAYASLFLSLFLSSERHAWKWKLVATFAKTFPRRVALFLLKYDRYDLVFSFFLSLFSLLPLGRSISVGDKARRPTEVCQIRVIDEDSIEIVRETSTVIPSAFSLLFQRSWRLIKGDWLKNLQTRRISFKWYVLTTWHFDACLRSNSDVILI